jgi:hypothetical protein
MEEGPLRESTRTGLQRMIRCARHLLKPGNLSKVARADVLSLGTLAMNSYFEDRPI